MKTAEQWQTELAGETSLESIRAIQADTLRRAALIAMSTKGERGKSILFFNAPTIAQMLCNEADILETPNKD